MKRLTIGQLAKASGLTNDTLRFYERLGLVKPAERGANGYRLFPAETLRQLQFIQRAKQLDFTLEEIKALLIVKGSPTANCEDIYQRLQKKIGEVDAKIAELHVFRQDLETIAKNCPRGTHSLADCSLMDFLDHPTFCHQTDPAPQDG